jgi:PfaD family protein
LILNLRDRICENFGYGKLIRIGAAGGISTPQSALAAFQMGADYVVTGSVNQACVEAGTSDYVKAMLAETGMSDVVMAPSADMFESGARVQVIKKGTMFPMNAQKLYDLYTKYHSLEEIPEKDLKALEFRVFKQDINSVWESVKTYFSRVDPRQIQKAQGNDKYKMGLVFRWYLGNSSRWAVNGEEDRKMDMQIWCGQSMGAFNKWTKGTELESPAGRTAAKIALAIMGGAAQLQLANLLKSAGV